MGKKEKEESFTRRHFFEIAGNGALGVVMLGGSIFTLQYLSPNVLLEPSSVFKAGVPPDFSPGSVTLNSKQKVFIIRDKSGYFYALSAVCTHLGCITSWKTEEGIIACPCHGSKFSIIGEKIAGPAPRSLPRLKIDLNAKNDLVVDKSVVISEDTILKV